ncbi:uncharacterized protein BT62DRAFT_938058 [Guyanagaster necrorhizus]|uniref:Uncharacterized protein n=1 Tax=Guyanagaster necrorhizus TaxID=856835 RepID=A0A9P7VHC2_9AGAR|nr:uncharacterized protein BT62DRAFT_938058 [Guyanagaster necrorhizus MCA 3950]KAG7440385.1 hypothetical protein BT62DRAFT_938058 [Guyanagaster necrorhizus MCA 3950]
MAANYLPPGFAYLSPDILPLAIPCVAICVIQYVWGSQFSVMAMLSRSSVPTSSLCSISYLLHKLYRQQRCCYTECPYSSDHPGKQYLNLTAYRAQRQA